MTKGKPEMGSATARALRVAMIGQKGYPPVHGGIEKHVAELASRLPAFGITVDIYSRPHYSALNGPADLTGVTVRRLPSIPTKHLDAMSHSLLATVDAIRQNFDIVHYHALGPGLLAGIPRLFRGIPTIVTVHGLDWQRDKWGKVARTVLRLGEAASVSAPSGTIVVSKALRAHYLTEQKCATNYIPNGIVAPDYRPPHLIAAAGVRGEFVLFVGRLVPEKGCHLLLAAWRELPAAVRQRYQLVIAGDGGFTPDYVDKLKQDAPDGVIFTGYVHGPFLAELFTNAALMVLPSTLEGLSITLLEGMSYGRCCLVSDIPPNVEASGGHAVLFRSGDANDLRGQLEKTLADPELRQSLGSSSQVSAIEHYSWDRVADMTARLYREVVER